MPAAPDSRTGPSKVPPPDDSTTRSAPSHRIPGPVRQQRFRRSRTVSRILSRGPHAETHRSAGAAIPLAPPSLTGSSNLPGGLGRAALGRLPIWSCSVRGLACRPPCGGRGALLPHLFTLTTRRGAWRYVFCATFLQVAPTGRYPAHCPAESGLSSPPDRGPGAAPDAAAARPTAAECQRTPATRRSPGGCGTAPASCRGYYGACRSPRRSARCSSRARAAGRRGSRARPPP